MNTTQEITQPTEADQALWRKVEAGYNAIAPKPPQGAGAELMLALGAVDAQEREMLNYMFRQRRSIGMEPDQDSLQWGKAVKTLEAFYKAANPGKGEHTMHREVEKRVEALNDLLDKHVNRGIELG